MLVLIRSLTLTETPSLCSTKCAPAACSISATSCLRCCSSRLDDVLDILLKPMLRYVDELRDKVAALLKEAALACWAATQGYLKVGREVFSIFLGFSLRTHRLPFFLFLFCFCFLAL